MVWILLSYIVIIPYFFLQGIDARQAQELCYQVMSVLVITSGLFFDNCKIKVNAINVTLGATCLWCLYLFISKYYMGWGMLLNIFLGIGVYFTAVKTLKKEDIHILIKGIGIFMIYSIVYFSFQHLGYDMRDLKMLVMGKPQGVPDCGFWGYKAPFGMFLAFTLPLILSMSWTTEIHIKFREGVTGIWNNVKSILSVYSINLLKILSACAWMCLLMVPIRYADSTIAIIAGVCGIMFFLWFRKRILVWFMVIPLIIGALWFVIKIDNPMGMQCSRINMWGKVIQDIHAEPLGHGLDSFRNPILQAKVNIKAIRYYKNAFNDITHRAVRTAKIDDIKVEDWTFENGLSEDEIKAAKARLEVSVNAIDFWDNAHNEFLQAGYEMGVPMMGGIIVLLYLLWIRFKRSTKTQFIVGSFASLMVIFLCSMTHFPLHLARTGCFVPIILAIFMLSTEDK